MFLNLWNQEEVRTWLKSEFWSNLARFGSRNSILTKFMDDSASFLPEKFKNHVILIKTLVFDQKSPQIQENRLKYRFSQGFLGTPVEPLCGVALLALAWSPAVDPLALSYVPPIRLQLWLYLRNWEHRPC